MIIGKRLHHILRLVVYNRPTTFLDALNTGGMKFADTANRWVLSMGGRMTPMLKTVPATPSAAADC